MTPRPPFLNSMADPLIKGAARYRRRRRRITAATLLVVAVAAGAFAFSALSGDGSDAVQVTVNEPDPTTTVSATTSAPPTTTTAPTTTAPPTTTTTTTVRSQLGQSRTEPAVHPVAIDGLPDRYVTLQGDGLLSVVNTATAAQTELARIRVPETYDSRGLQMVVDPTGEYIYVASDPNRDCQGIITRVAVDSGETTELSKGFNPMVSPDGLWLFHTIDGATARGETPPEPTDITEPCRGRHDSYAWMDLTTGTEQQWVAPPLKEFADPINLYPTTFEPGSHRLYLASFAIYTGFRVITPESIGTEEPIGAFDNAGEGFDTLLINGLWYLPDGSLLIAGQNPDVGLPPGARQYHPPENYEVGPEDVSQPWWLVTGYHGEFPGDWSGPVGTWVWDQINEPVLLAENLSVRWLP